MLNLNLSGRRALVCGASQGIGAAAAHALAQCGANVMLLARSEDRLAAVCNDLPGSGHQYQALDLSEPDALTTHLPNLADSGCHILVNNSGGPAAGLAIDAEPQAFEAAFRQHLLASQHLVKALVPGMRQAGYGRIINVISTSVKEPIAGLGVSNTIRGAVANWAKTLAGELGPDGITVNNLLPGATETPRLESLISNTAVKRELSEEQVRADMLARIPLRRFCRPEETAAAIAFLASPLAAYINGINLPVDGGRLGCL